MMQGRRSLGKPARAPGLYQGNPVALPGPQIREGVLW